MAILTFILLIALAIVGLLVLIKKKKDVLIKKIETRVEHTHVPAEPLPRAIDEVHPVAVTTTEVKTTYTDASHIVNLPIESTHGENK